MRVDSIGFKTDFIFTRYNGLIRDHGNMIELRTPENPAFYFGNGLLFERAPNPDELDEYIRLFKATFADNPAIRHVTLMWLPTSKAHDSTVKRFAELGYNFSRDVVLAAQKTRLTRPAPDGVEFRTLETDLDWNMALENQVANRDKRYEETPYHAFKATQMLNYRAMQNDGIGHWFGGFIGPQLVADMGMFHGHGVSRFQLVGTHPAYRKRGICSALVHHVSQQTRATHPDNQLVIIAQTGKPAERIYRALGFKHVEVMEAAVLQPA